MKTVDINQQLSSCDREAIHLVSTIQSYGYFFAFSERDKKVYAASENLAALCGKSIEDVLDSRLEQVLSPEFAQLFLRSSRKMREDGSKESFLVLPFWQGYEYEAYLYPLDDLTAVEIQPNVTTSPQAHTAVTHLELSTRHFVEALQKQTTVQGAARLACRFVRDLTGFDRVMMYQFLPNWDGVVIAEDKTPEAHSFLDHRFPATDIPKPARQLYLRNRNRFIYQTSLEVSPIRPALHPTTGKAFDLSDSKLRAVSPIHLEYLKNMGVASSFSVAVIIEGQLWGLIACHGLQETQLSHRVRLTCETLSSAFATVAHTLLSLEEQGNKLLFHQNLQETINSLRNSPRPLKTFFEKWESLCAAFRIDGFAVVQDGAVETAGMAPPYQIVTQIAQILGQEMHDHNLDYCSTDYLAAYNKEWEGMKDIASGALVVRMSETDTSSMLVMFRREFVKTILWGGNPEKTLEKRNYQGVINPRKSFESWTETTQAHSAPWTQDEIQGALFLKSFVFDVIIRKHTLIEELRGRIQKK